MGVITGSQTIFETVPIGADTENTTILFRLGSGTIDLSPGETEIITFDVFNSESLDDPTFSVGAAPSAGDLVVNEASIGTFTFTITQAQWVAAGSPNAVELVFADDDFGSSFGSEDAVYTLTITCFAPGTLIGTCTEPRPVESLKIGDQIRTADGRDVAVKWVGMQTVSTVFSGHVERLQPVRISAGALGDGLPHTDLTVTADHGMVIDALVINASALVNGTTIRFLPMAEIGETFTVYHIETEDHDVILANGAPTETFIDHVSRAVFDNHQDYLDLYGDETSICEMDLPRVTASRLVPAQVKTIIGSAHPSRFA